MTDAVAAVAAASKVMVVNIVGEITFSDGRRSLVLLAEELYRVLKRHCC